MKLVYSLFLLQFHTNKMYSEYKLWNVIQSQQHTSLDNTILVTILVAWHSQSMEHASYNELHVLRLCNVLNRKLLLSGGKCGKRLFKQLFALECWVCESSRKARILSGFEAKQSKIKVSICLMRLWLFRVMWTML